MSERPRFGALRLSECHRPLLEAFLGRQPDANAFMLERLAAFGVAGGRIAFWGAFAGNRIVGACVLLDGSASVAAVDADCLVCLTPHVCDSENLSGPAEAVEALLAHLPPDRVIWRQVDWLCRLDAIRFCPAEHGNVRPATPDDLNGLCALYTRSEAFRNRDTAHVVQHLRQQLVTCRYFVAEASGCIVSAAALVAQARGSAMLVSAFSAPEHRGRGLATSVVSAACAAALADGLRLRLLYREENEPARRLYARLGFQQVARWLMVRLKPAAQPAFDDSPDRPLLRSQNQ